MTIKRDYFFYMKYNGNNFAVSLKSCCSKNTWYGFLWLVFILITNAKQLFKNPFALASILHGIEIKYATNTRRRVLCMWRGSTRHILGENARHWRAIFQWDLMGHWCQRRHHNFRLMSQICSKKLRNNRTIGQMLFRKQQQNNDDSNKKSNIVIIKILLRLPQKEYWQ